MLIIALMAALTLGTVLGAFGNMADTSEDEPSTPEDTGMDPDPVAPLPEPESEVADEAVDPVDPVDPVEDAPVGLTLSYNGDATILGGAGDDTLLGDPTDGSEEVAGTTQIDLGAGNDLAEVSLDALVANGGEGNDTLSALAGNATLNGGAGDDVLSGNREGLLEGNEGNDTITVELDFPFDGETTVLAGDGDDLINIEAGLRADNTGGEFVRASGGSGADTFNLELEVEDDLLVVDGPVSGSSTAGIRILDFDAAEDVLQIELTRPDGADARAPSDVTFTREAGEAELGPFTRITLVFDGSDTVMPFETTFDVHGDDTLTIDNIVFVEPAADMSGDDTMAAAT